MLTWNKYNLRISSSAEKLKRLALGTIKARLLLKTSPLIFTVAVLMCLRSQGRIRIRTIFLGVLVGLGVAVVFVMWTSEVAYMKQKSVMRNNAGERMFFTFSNGAGYCREKFCQRAGRWVI